MREIIRILEQTERKDIYFIEGGLTLEQVKEEKAKGTTFITAREELLLFNDEIMKYKAFVRIGNYILCMNKPYLARFIKPKKY